MTTPRFALRAMQAIAILAISPLISSCDAIRDILGGIGERFETVTLNPTQTATFSTSDHGTCAFDGFNTSGLPSPRFLGIGTAAVGDNGLLNPGNEQFIHTMRAAIRFDLSSIPSSATNIVGELRFNATLTSRSESGDPCPIPVDRVERVTSSWDGTSDFESPLPSAPIGGSRCIRDGASFTCTVSEAVQNWIADPASFPNHGFVVSGPVPNYDACGGFQEGVIGPPGNILECAATLSGIELEVVYEAP